MMGVTRCVGVLVLALHLGGAHRRLCCAVMLRSAIDHQGRREALNGDRGDQKPGKGGDPRLAHV